MYFEIFRRAQITPKDGIHDEWGYDRFIALEEECMEEDYILGLIGAMEGWEGEKVNSIKEGVMHKALFSQSV